MGEETEKIEAENDVEMRDEVEATTEGMPPAPPEVEAPVETDTPAPVKAETQKPSRVAAKVTAPKSAPSGLRTSDGRGRRKVRVGRVVSDRMDKTAVVAVERLMRHPLYGKIIRRTEKFKAHDGVNECGIGDLVEIMETRPLSREKRWRVVRVVEKAK